MAVYLREIVMNAPESELAHAAGVAIRIWALCHRTNSAASFCFGALESEAARILLSYEEKGGGSILATVKNQPPGFTAWRSRALG